MKKQYKFPQVKVVNAAPAAIICASVTEGPDGHEDMAAKGFGGNTSGLSTGWGN